MNCGYNLTNGYESYKWSYDGKKIYWNGIPFSKSGKTDLGDGVSFTVSKLSGTDNFKIQMVYVFLAYDFKNDYNKTSEIEIYGMRIFGDCY